MDFRLSVGPVVAAEGVAGSWVIRAEAILLAVALWVGILEELVLRAGGGEVAWECVQVGRLHATGPSCSRARNCPY